MTRDMLRGDPLRQGQASQISPEPRNGLHQVQPCDQRAVEMPALRGRPRADRRQAAEIGTPRKHHTSQDGDRPAERACGEENPPRVGLHQPAHDAGDQQQQRCRHPQR